MTAADNSNLNKDGWDQLSHHYQKSVTISTHEVHYGPNGPGDDTLHLIGDLEGKLVLDIGCGGGQTSIAMARKGAKVVAVDQSTSQIEHAKKLAKHEGVEVDFRVLPAEQISSLTQEDHQFDLVFSSFALSYVEDIELIFQQAWELLKPQGRVIAAVGHPITPVGWPENQKNIQGYSYFERKSEQWNWETPEGEIPFKTYSRTFSDWFNAFSNAGFTVIQVLEPEMFPSEKIKESPYYDTETEEDRGRWERIPLTIIFVAQRS